MATPQGKRIATLRQTRGWSVARLAEDAGIEQRRLAAIESGEERADDAELARLRAALGVTVDQLPADAPADAPPLPSFRLAREVPLRAARAAIDRVTALARRFVELERILEISRPITPLEALETYRATPERPGIAPQLAGKHAAGTVRGALGVGDGPATNLADRLEVEGGMRIFFLDDLPASIAGLVIWSQELGPVIGINRGHARGRRRWSLAHEVAYFLRDRDAGNVLPAAGWHRATDNDAFTDSFTRAFLLPEASVKKQFADRCRANGGRFRVADILWLGTLYGVSFRRMSERLEELGMFPRGTYETLTRDAYRPDETAGVPSRAPLERRRPHPFPVRYVTLAFEAFERELISERALADYLETDRFSVRGLYHRWCFQVLDDGSEVELRLSDDVATLD